MSKNQSQIEERDINKKIKGEKDGLCNRTDCQSPYNVIWFNHSTRKYYCTSCAHMLNDDPYNARDAQRLWKHDLCTRETQTKESTNAE